jgi:hypothetical protein
MRDMHLSLFATKRTGMCSRPICGQYEYTGTNFIGRYQIELVFKLELLSNSMHSLLTKIFNANMYKLLRCFQLSKLLALQQNMQNIMT